MVIFYIINIIFQPECAAVRPALDPHMMAPLSHVGVTIRELFQSKSSELQLRSAVVVLLWFYCGFIVVLLWHGLS